MHRPRLPRTSGVRSGTKSETLEFFASVSLTMMASSDCSLVNVAVDLPKELAADVEAVRQRDPEFLERAIQYVLARRIIFEELRTPASRHR